MHDSLSDGPDMGLFLYSSVPAGSTGLQVLSDMGPVLNSSDSNIDVAPLHDVPSEPCLEQENAMQLIASTETFCRATARKGKTPIYMTVVRYNTGANKYDGFKIHLPSDAKDTKSKVKPPFDPLGESHFHSFYPPQPVLQPTLRCRLPSQLKSYNIRVASMVLHLMISLPRSCCQASRVPMLDPTWCSPGRSGNTGTFCAGMCAVSTRIIKIWL